MTLLYLLLSFSASTIGAISGIGGGIIMKPLLDLFNNLDAASINFLSGCTVFSMSCVALSKSLWQKQEIQFKESSILASGSMIGGFIGKHLFHLLLGLFSTPLKAKLIQSIFLLIITLAVQLYFSGNCQNVPREHIRNNMTVTFSVGLLLGSVSVFLGIGGGPLNLAVLSICFALPQKDIALNSIYIIFFSQLSGLVSIFLQHNLPEIPYNLIIVMILGGITGGYAGTNLRLRLSPLQSKRLFNYILLFILLINVYNTFHFFTLTFFK